MPVNTILLDFSVKPKQLENDYQLLLTNMENVLRDYLKNLKLVNTFTIDGGIFKLYTSDMASIVNVRVFSSGLITITIEYYKGENQEALLSYEHVRKIEQKMYLTLNCFRSKTFPPIKRGGSFDPYLLSSDERLLEYDIDQLVFEETSPFQKIQIVHSKSLGNMLVLDDLQNISEADLIYTETIMARGKENYNDKEIVILGGGDGGLLYELLKENPKYIVMLEIDEIVMHACAKHMRSVCGDVLDQRSAPNYEIVVGDCVKLLEEFVKEGRKFDYVFGDLTDIPINDLPTSEMWVFIQNILNLSFKVLKPDGKFMTHGNGTNCKDSLLKYEALLANIDPPVNINKSQAYIPSFMEDWVFYQINFASKV